MKIKDIERTANVAWSPKNQPTLMLAAGTAAQQLDATFNTNAALELYALNLNEIGPDCLLKSTVSSEQRFHKLIWGPMGVGDYGTVIGGCDGGLIKIYSVTKLLNNENAITSQPCKHQGPVHALDFNPFQQNLFATGAGESEIFIWDMNNTNTPMSPGAKSQPLEDVLSVAWNRQVQHILASTFAPKCVIWDLRKNEPIIKLTDTVSRVRWKVVAWHPEVATQLCLASEEDHSPIIQLWDLRFATSPLKTLENHQRGILSMAWCAEDPDLLISCGKDNRILAWNPNSGQQTTTATNQDLLGEVAHTNQWNFDIQWCPRNPAIIACPNYDGHVSIYSLMGGKVQQIQTTNKIADSFPGMDGYTQLLQQQPQQQQNLQQISTDLNRAPKWMKRPVGASFGFGGKLVTFENFKLQPGQTQDNIKRSIYVSQVITEPDLVKKSMELEQALEYGNFVEYCKNKADSLQDQHKKYIWHFLRANFEDNPRAELLNLLGYRIEDVNNKLNQFIGKRLGGLNHQMANLNTNDVNNIDPFDNLNQIEESKPVKPFQIKTGDDIEGLITQALLLGNVEAAVELCLESKRYADAIIIAMTGGTDLLARTQHAYLEQCNNNYLSSLITALITEDWTSIINNCDLNSWKEALAATLTHTNDEQLPKLCQQLGERLENQNNGDLQLKQDSQLCYICSGSFDKLVNSWCTNIKNSNDDLQDLIELVMFLQKSIERNGKHVEINGKLADLLSYYSSILASQGNLKTALIYLNDSQDEKIQELRDRLCVNLGQKSLYNQRQQPQQLPPQSRRNSSRNPSISSMTNYPSVPPVPSIATQFNTGLPSAVQPWQNQSFPPPPSTQQQPLQNRAFSPVPPPLQPPRPTSGSGLQRKYVLDPSVTSNQYGLPPNKSVYQPQQVPPVPNYQSPMNNFMPQTMPLVPPPPPEIGQPAISERSVVPPPPPISSGASGWNDPPVLNRPLRPQAKPEVPPPSQPITHPLYGSTATTTQQIPLNNGYNNDVMQTNYNQEPPTNLFQPSSVPPLPGSIVPQQTNMFNPSGFRQNAIIPPTMVPSNSGINQAVPQQVEQVPAVVEKPPIPEEHLHMKTVLEELKNQCSCAANNPQTKRKLDDVGRKLEALYDLLREHKLSQQTLTSLHQLIQMIQDGNYTGGLNLHTQLVSGPDFAQIASFMPGLKVLLQCALQLQVYIR